MPSFRYHVRLNYRFNAFCAYFDEIGLNTQYFNLSWIDGSIEVESPLWIVLLLQCPQLRQPPWLTAIHLLRCLISGRVVDIRVKWTPRRISCMDYSARLFSIGVGYCVESVVGRVDWREGAIQGQKHTTV